MRLVRFHVALVSILLPLKADDVIGSGTGFAASVHGHILTNAHVISGCKSVIAKVGGTEVAAGTISVDSGNDIALLKIPLVFKNVPSLRVGLGVQLGESVTAFGYPLQGVLAKSLNMTIGNVSSLIGLSEDTRSFQFTAAVQPGSSGGPLVDTAGNVVGIVTSKLSPLWTASNTGDLPQNVNFALRASIIRDFLESRGVVFPAKAVSIPIPATELAATFEGVTFPLQCLGDSRSGAAVSKSGNNSKQPRAEKHKGVLVAGFGVSEEFFEAVFQEIQNTLVIFGVKVATKESELRAGTLNSVSLPNLLEAVRQQGSDSLLYVTVERRGMNISLVRLRCFDVDGKLLWEDSASNSHQLFGTEQSAARFVMKQLKKKLEPHIGKPGLPLR